MKTKSRIGFSFFRISVLAAVALGTVASLAVFAGAERSNEVRNGSLRSDRIHSSTVAARTSMRVTSDGAIPDYQMRSKLAPLATQSSESHLMRPFGNTLW